MDIGLIQQGDVLFYRMDELPEGVAPKDPEGDLAIFAYGEESGHSHSAIVEIVDGNPNFRLYERNGTLYVEVLRITGIVHQEHKPVILAPGIYRRGLVREVDPFVNGARSVRD